MSSPSMSEELRRPLSGGTGVNVPGGMANAERSGGTPSLRLSSGERLHTRSALLTVHVADARRRSARSTRIRTVTV